MKNTSKFIIYPTIITAIVAGCVSAFINLPSAFASVTTKNGDLVITIPSHTSTSASTPTVPTTPQSTASPITQIIREREDGYQEALKKAYDSEKKREIEHEAERPNTTNMAMSSDVAIDATLTTNGVTIAGALSSPINPPSALPAPRQRPTEIKKADDDKRNPQATPSPSRSGESEHGAPPPNKPPESHEGDDHQSTPQPKRSK